MQKHLAELKTAEEHCRSRVSTLLADEDLTAGITHAAAIHTLKQERMELQFQITLFENRLKRLSDAG